MTRNRTLKRPSHAAGAAFLVLSIFMTIGLFFDPELNITHAPVAYGYCALLSVGSIGLIMAGRNTIKILAAPSVAALIAWGIGIVEIYKTKIPDLEGAAIWFQVSQFFLMIAAALGLWIITRSWVAYFFGHKVESPISNSEL